jgi:hypothetical protein
MIDISANVQAEVARKRPAVTQRRVAELAAISWSTWTRRMNYPGTWRADELAEVARVLGVDVERFMVRTEAPGGTS